MRNESPITDHTSLALSASKSTSTEIRSALGDAIVHLESAHTPSAPLAAELLLMHALGVDRTFLYAHPEQELDTATRERFFSLIAQRASGVPTQHLTGHQEFWGLEFEVTPDVLVPRPETEHLIEVALDRLGASAGGDSHRRRAPLRIADVGTGSGCIAIVLAKELPGAHIVATDISAGALKVARRNAARYDVSQRIEFIECNLLYSLLQESRFVPPSGPQGKRITLRYRSRQASHPSPRLRASQSPPFDLIASNPPYIGRCEASTLPREVREHEPDAALFGGETGTEIYGPLIAQAAMSLKSGGIVVLELGHNSAEHVLRLLAPQEWHDVSITNDLAGIGRVISAVRF